MEGQSSTGQSQYLYQSAQWSRLVRRNTLTALSPIVSSSPLSSPQFPTQIDIPPSLLPQSTSTYQAQLAHYNKLITSGRSTRLQSSPLPPLLSAQHIHSVSRSSSAGFEHSGRARKTSRGGHGNKNAHNTANGDRPLIAQDDPTNMSTNKKPDSFDKLPLRPLARQHNSSLTQQSSSVPSTPHQHARQFSLGSREPSPNAVPGHSPRSAYSETNSTLPSLRPLPQKYGGCKYETAMAHSRRRMPYNIGSDELEKAKPSSIKAKMTGLGEEKLMEDMHELYDRLLPSPESEAKRERFVQKLEKLMNNEWPGHDIRVHMFGSSGNMLYTDESDVDICITTEWKELEGVCMLAALLAKHGMEKVICVSNAKVPIVKIWDPELGLACDMNVNNTLALENTRMIKTYVQLDDRVRPLAMIIKHWTKRRILNDAAFGGTLSSYTWICMIINFLQTRDPPIVPALHQRPHQKLPAKDGLESSFADDLSTLQGFGNGNTETLGELLFHFFRFYGYEMDYDNSVVSVRNGKLISKYDKQWHLATNNRLCVEEPFNTVRNLGNTADDTSFRGLHLELRRAFDLIAEGKLDECCEEYVFPKEEERFWERPPPQPKPVLSRSASQNRGPRGGGNTGRQGRNNNHNRNGNNGRRASSGTTGSGSFERNVPYVPISISDEAWMQAQSQDAQSRLHNDLITTFSVLRAQENSLRMQLYTQSQAYAQAQAQARYAQQHQIQSNGVGAQQTQQQATDRHRGNSFDNPPLTAPIRQEPYFYSLQYPPVHMYGHQAPSTYPSSPLLSPALPESRRSLHRSTVTGGSGNGQQGISNSSLRSQSQPATRTMLSPNVLHGIPYGINGYTNYQPIRQGNGGYPIPNFMADEGGEPAYDNESITTLAESPPDAGIPKEYVGWRVHDGSPSVIPQIETLVPSAIPNLGDLSHGRRRRGSTEQFPQAILDRLRRDSRSPSPLGRDRKQPTGIHSPLLSAGSFQQNTPRTNLRASNDHSPLIVNGSTFVPMSQDSARQLSPSETSQSEDQNYDSLVGSVPLLSQLPMLNGVPHAVPHSVGLGVTIQPNDDGRADSGIALKNRTLHAKDTSSVSASLTNGSNIGLSPVEQANGWVRLSPTGRGRPSRLPQNGGMSPLDITPSLEDLRGEQAPHLSPVYEAQTPSPTVIRKFESFQAKVHYADAPSAKMISKEETGKPTRAAFVKNAQKSLEAPSGKVNGHTRGSKSEGGGPAPGVWQKISGPKKKGQAAHYKLGTNGILSQGEQVPKDNLERKGG